MEIHTYHVYKAVNSNKPCLGRCFWLGLGPMFRHLYKTGDHYKPNPNQIHVEFRNYPEILSVDAHVERCYDHFSTYLSCLYEIFERSAQLYVSWALHEPIANGFINLCGMTFSRHSEDKFWCKVLANPYLRHLDISYSGMTIHDVLGQEICSTAGLFVYRVDALRTTLEEAVLTALNIQLVAKGVTYCVGHAVEERLTNMKQIINASALSDGSERAVNNNISSPSVPWRTDGTEGVGSGG